MTKNDQKLLSRLRHRITIQQENSDVDDAGGSDPAWEDVATVWAEIKPLSGRSSAERVDAGAIVARGLFLVTIRYLEGITPAMRVAYGARVFNIRSVVDIDLRHEAIEMLVEEGVAV